MLLYTIARASLGSNNISVLLNIFNTLRSNVVPSANNMQSLVSQVYYNTILHTVIFHSYVFMLL